MIFVVIFTAYLLSVIFLLPAYLVMFHKKIFNVYSSSLISFFIIFLTFCTFFLISGADYNSLTAGAEVLVEEGVMTAAGYARASYSAFLIGLFGMLGGFIFSIFVRGRKVFRLSFV